MLPSTHSLAQLCQRLSLPSSRSLARSLQITQEYPARNLSKVELLRQAEPAIVQGFVPPILARVLYQGGDARSRPWSAAIADSAKDHAESHIAFTSHRRASGSQTGSASEEVYTKTHFYGDLLGCRDVIATIEQAGLGALFPGKTDALLMHGRPSMLKSNSTQAPPEMGGWENACGIAYISAPRSSVLLSASFSSSPSLSAIGSPPSLPSSGNRRSSWWANISLSEEAKNHLHALALLLKDRKNKQAQDSSLDFFR